MTWDENKRQSNIKKHGLDFAHAGWVLDSIYRMDIEVMRHGEKRVQSFSYVPDVLAVLALVYVCRDEKVRIISFRTASSREREIYYGWIESQQDEP